MEEFIDGGDVTKIIDGSAAETATSYILNLRPRDTQRISHCTNCRTSHYTNRNAAGKAVATIRVVAVGKVVAVQQ